MTSISVIVPTTGARNLYLAEALHSVAAQQTSAAVEIIVVCDGCTQAEVMDVVHREAPNALVVGTIQRIGGGAARNFGVRHASGDYIAFLDDDDVWMTSKLDRQLTCVSASSTSNVVISTALSAMVGELFVASFTRTLPPVIDCVSEALFCPDSWLGPLGSLATSTLLTTRDLATKHPFDESLPYLQDIDWVLRAEHDFGAQICVVESREIVYRVASTGNISSTRDWRRGMDWASRNRRLFSARSWSGFHLNYLSRVARSPKAFPTLVHRAIDSGDPTVGQLAACAAGCAAPRKLIRKFSVGRKRVLRD